MEEHKEEEIYKVEYYEVIIPMRTNGDKIFNEEKFEVRMWREEDKKVVFLKKKTKYESL